MEAVKAWQWYVLWSLLFLNVTAGIAVLSQAAPMAQEITGVTALVAAGLVGIFAIANGLGRLVWAWLSDLVGRKWVFLIMYLLQAVLFFSLTLTNSFVVFTALRFVILLCYGGSDPRARDVTRLTPVAHHREAIGVSPPAPISIGLRMFL